MTATTTSPTDLSRDEIFVAGSWRRPEAGGRIEVENPATEEIIATIPEAGTAEADAAMAAARRVHAEGSWRRMTFEQRGQVLARIADGLNRRSEELGRLYTLDQGGLAAFAPYMGSIADVIVRDHVELAATFQDAPEDRDTPRGRALIYREPVGPVVAIVPWNAPLILGVVKLAPALLAGCPVVVKVSPETPLVSFVMAEVFAEAGLPEGVVSFLPGGRELGQYLVSHPETAHVSFTGSSASGQQVMRAAADNMVRVTLELGGKSAAMVLEDADPAEVAGQLLGSCMGQAGQVCTTQSRILVPRAQRDQWVDMVAATFSSFPVGDPTDPNTLVGPLVSAGQRARTEGYLDAAQAGGARVVTGGKRPAHLERGYYIEPTLLDDVTQDMVVAREEVFGPVICLLAYDDVDDAVRIANDTEFGLGNGIYTNDIDRAIEIGQRLESGTVSINSSGTIMTEPFGGWKKSGIGREGGREGVEAFFEYKQIQLTPFPRG